MQLQLISLTEINEGQYEGNICTHNGKCYIV